ncbi:stage II sporulation protein R [Paenisporosarcina cavernae]|uniref:Stage II sporulation protein R n=1 Tax=Paenisporosarcina cavernae TaxID=2320858 RepID=A0A385YPZ9_9BACL|nr:stage II sporulation protein R [Paenisporosarcina cavernae]AYC28819.1 hypothetical protein D3873_02630 [Paenisporosarcina cavernae]
MLPSLKVIGLEEKAVPKKRFGKLVPFVELMIGLFLFYVIFTGIPAEDPTAEAFRVRIIAHSNSLADQAEKMAVEQAIQPILLEAVRGSVSVNDVKIEVEKAIPAMKEVAMQLVSKPVAIAIKQELFPPKVWEAMFTSQDFYEALVIEIGDARGDNWWCNLFPSLCYKEDTLQEEKTKFFVWEWLKEKFDW